MDNELIFRQAQSCETDRIMQIIRQAQARMHAAGSRQWQDGYPSPETIRRDLLRGDGRIVRIDGAAAAYAAFFFDGYPAPGHISADIGRNRGYVLCKPGVEGPLSVIAYGAVVFDGEPAYDAIDGQWLTDEPYVLVHRIAVADGERGRGVAAEFLHRVETLAQERGVKAFRIDTNFDNQTMLRLLERTGFTYCGKVVYRSGERLAYEKRI